ncbi:2-oxo acid dehydrogenase subunit E2 [Gammaproteobacteria bacterium]|nr:2-oxo acid dehydrogenase subunit E2 [Gammaproteobacteria bacterium]MDC0387304.1 2-oxo acid dehydrogenase subunit E2 [Gammaproteobacteria bacterium]
MTKKIINIPDLGEAEDVEVIEICAKVGDQVDSEDPIIVLESDKAAMEIPASVVGKVISIEVSVGDTVSSGSPFLQIETTDQEPSHEKENALEQKVMENHIISERVEEIESKPPLINEQQNTPTLNSKNIYAGPAVRKLAREFGIDLSLVRPSGPKKRIVKEDLHVFVKFQLSSANKSNSFEFTQPDIDYSKWGSIKEEKLSKFQKSSLANLHTSWINIPHVTQHDECDLTILLDIRAQLCKKHKVKISPLAFIAKITTAILYEFPLLNSSLDSNLENIILKDYVNLGIAIDTPEGLIVPNVKNAQLKSIVDISSEINELAEAAKKRKLNIADLKGASFSISSLGAIGGKFFTPIINPPEVAILGISKSYEKIVSSKAGFEGRSFLPISLSYDHRAINGVYAVQFTSQLGEALSDRKLIEKSFK